jgi:hypothetical protein
MLSAPSRLRIRLNPLGPPEKRESVMHLLVQQNDIPPVGVPPRAELDAMLAAPGETDVPRYWVLELSKARDQFDEAEQLPDGSERLIELIDSASDIEEQAVREFSTTA